MTSLAQQLTKTAEGKSLHRPTFFRISGHPEQMSAFQRILDQPNIFVYDDIYNQLKELIKSRNPGKKLLAVDYAQLIEEHLNGCPITEYGVWVLYPWSSRLVHLLDEQEFIELRTSANRNKISAEERDILATKSIGVIGLSVGQSVSVTLAMERGCGELRLADFDTLELNNLNRIRTGVHNLGLLKVYSVAREIAEIDPFIKVVCYEAGINSENIDDFFTKGGKLDAVIDECDGVNVKILCRLKAKELQVPVLMEASDRGTLDIERFDLEPQRPIMHGWLEHLSLDLDVLEKLETNEQKLPYMLPIAGFSTLSSRMKASLLEMNVSITTWPQLATAVTLGGAITADTCRRIFLNQLTVSGRYFIDLEQLIPEINAQKAEVISNTTNTLTLAQLQQIIDQEHVLTTSAPAPKIALVSKWVYQSVQSTSIFNLHPWKWHFGNRRLLLELWSPLSYQNVDNLNSLLSAGRAIEKLASVAAAEGYQMVVNELTVFDRLVLQLEFSESGTQNGADNFESNPTIEFPEIECFWIDDEQQVITMKEAIAISERLNYLIPESHNDYFQHIINFPGSSRESGLSFLELGLTPADGFALNVISNPDVARVIMQWPKGGSALEAPIRRRLVGVKKFGVIAINQRSTNTILEVGRMLERLGMQHATDIEVWLSPVVHAAHLRGQIAQKIPLKLQDEVEFISETLKEMEEKHQNRQIVCIFSLNNSGSKISISQIKEIDEILNIIPSEQVS